MKSLKAWVPAAIMGCIIAALMMAGPTWVERIAYAAEQGRHEAAQARLRNLSKQDHLSELFHAVTKVVQPAVVEVRVTKMVTRPGFDPEDFFGPDSPLPEQFRRQLPRQPERSVPVQGLGSGVVVDAEEGYVLTCWHVVGDSDEVEIILHDGRIFKATWVRADPATDVAVLKIDAPNLIEAPLGNSEEAHVGQWVLALGSPRGLRETVTAGIVSATGRAPRGVGAAYQNSIQTDAAINKGNSGGPLVNMQGKVIGLNNVIISGSGGNEGIGFAVASNLAKQVMEQLIKKGRVDRGFLGVKIQDLTPRIAESLDVPDTDGVLITEVLPGTPADKAGLRIEDVIVAVDGEPTDTLNTLRNTIAAYAPGSEVEITYYRDGKRETTDLTLTALPDDMVAGPGGMPGEPGTARTGRYGFEMSRISNELANRYGYEGEVRGVMITNVDEESDAFRQGLRPGLVITHVNSQEVQTPADFSAAIKDEQLLRLRVVTPGGGAQIILVEPEDN